MNDKYIEAANGQIVVFDENSETKIIENRPGFEEVLEQENLVEQIEKEIEKKNAKIDFIKSNKWKIFIPKILIIGVTLWTLAIAISFGIGHVACNLSLDTFKTIYFKVLPGIVGFFGAIQGIKTSSDMSELKDLNGYKLQLTYLQDKLVNEKEKLESLRYVNSKTNNDSNEETSKLISSNDPIITVSTRNINDLGDTLGLCYDVGYNYKDYLLALKQALLKKEIMKQHGCAYSDADVDGVMKSFTKTFKNKKKPN